MGHNYRVGDWVTVGHLMKESAKVEALKKLSALSFVGAALFIGAAPSVVLAQEAADSLPRAGDTNATPEYRINPGDELQISVWREEELQREVMVLPDGTLSFPLVGTIQGAGRTPREIEQAISAGLASKYVDGNVPEVTVAVLKTSGLQFSVIGKVRTAGIFNPGRYVTLLEALSFAGGIDEFASLDNVAIIRKTSSGLTLIPARLSAILRSKSISPEAVSALPMIQSGDTVIVP